MPLKVSMDHATLLSPPFPPLTASQSAERIGVMWCGVELALIQDFFDTRLIILTPAPYVVHVTNMRCALLSPPFPLQQHPSQLRAGPNRGRGRGGGGYILIAKLHDTRGGWLGGENKTLTLLVIV